MSIASVLTPDEMRMFMKRSDLKATWSIACTFAIIAFAFAIAALWPGVLSWILATLLIGGRILGIAVLSHDASHNALFTSRKINYFIGKWVLRALDFGDFDSYRIGHGEHHRLSGTDNDPDLFIVAGYPTSAASLRRKFFRDFTGRTGFRDLYFTLRESTVQKRVPTLLAHTTLFSLLWIAGHPVVYVLWWVAYIFIYPGLMRLQAMGEHGGVANPLSPDARDNTGTTLANPLERLFISPNYVNFHVEHHAIAGAPEYNLPKMHRMLQERGYYDQHDCIAHGYINVIRRCTGTPKNERRPYIAKSIVQRDVVSFRIGVCLGVFDCIFAVTTRPAAIR